MGGLGEEVEEVKLGERVAGGGEVAEVGGKCFRRAGDVDEGWRTDASEQCADLGASAGAGWVEDDEVGAVALEDGGLEEVEGGGFDGVAIGELSGGEGRECGLGDLDGGDLSEVCGECAGEEADAGIEVRRPDCPAAVCGDQREEFWEKVAVDLEEGSAGDPVAEVRGSVVD